MNKPGLWTKDFIAVSMVSLFLSLSFYLLLVIMSVYAMDTFHSSPSAAGLAASIFLIGGIIARLLLGRWIERIGRRKMLFLSLILNLVMMVLYLVANGYVFLLFVRFFHGAAFGIAIPVSVSIVANIIPDERRGEGMAYYLSLSGALGAAIGPFLGMFLMQHGNYSVIFGVCTIFAVLALLITFVLSVPEIKLTQEQLKETKEFKFGRFFAIKAIPISIVGAVIYFCYSSVMTFLSAYSREINLIEIASFFFVVSSIAIILSRPFVGRLFDLKGENIVMYPAILIFMVGLFLLSRTNNGYTLLLAGVLVGIGLGNINSSGNTIAVKAVLPHQTGLAASTFITSMDIGLGIGPFILGLFVPFTGYKGVYLGVAIVMLACVFLYYLLHGKDAGRTKIRNSQKA
jgi:MFS family permease